MHSVNQSGRGNDRPVCGDADLFEFVAVFQKLQHDFRQIGVQHWFAPDQLHPADFIVQREREREVAE